MLCNCTLSGTTACRTCPNSPNNKTSEYTLPSSLIFYNEKPLIQAKVVTKYFCSICEKEIDLGSSYCKHCGAKLSYDCKYL